MMRISVVRSNRRSLEISVRADGEIIVRAPLFTGEQEIRRFTERHLDWIERQKQKAERISEQRAHAQVLSETELKALAEEAKKDFRIRSEYFAGIIGVSSGKITIRHQKSKWGSCSSRGNLNFNCLLMLAPEKVRDYVVVHELCHRKWMDHSPHFWAEVRRAMPDYDDAKRWLRENGANLMLQNPER